MKIQTGLTNGQVLQRLGKKGASLQIRGACDHIGDIRATLFDSARPLTGWKKRVVGQAAKGRFSVSLKGIPAGGPYRLELEAGKEIAIVKSFFVGDVWLLAGQSNMEGVGDMTHPAKPHPLVHSFSCAHEWALAKDPLHVLRESPDICHHNGVPLNSAEAKDFRRNAKKGVGVGIFFGHEMHQRSGVPQGLICTAHGGTSMAQWDPDLKSQKGTSLYYSMLQSHAATGQPVAGVLWYQGESDANEEARGRYTERMKKLVAATRRDLRQPGLPWIIVQLGRFFEAGHNFAAWNDIQEQQRLLPSKIKNLEIVPAIDLPLDDLIHISAVGYPRLGARMAHAADRLVHGNKKEPRLPVVRDILHHAATQTSVGAMGPSIDVFFDNIVGGLRSDGEANGFTLVTADGTVWPHCYKTTLHGNFARLHLGRSVGDGIKLHYGYGTMPVCNITDGRRISLPVFGPLHVVRQQATLPFVTMWRVSDVVAEPAAPLAELDCPDLTTLPTRTKSYGPDGFINEHAEWINKSGHAYFTAELEFPEPMKLDVLMGYDGPFRLWIDGKAFFSDLKGTNPCMPDEGRKAATLPTGRYRVTVAMDINRGIAWGFMLRFVRRDVSKAQLKADTYHRIAYSV